MHDSAPLRPIGSGAAGTVSWARPAASTPSRQESWEPITRTPCSHALLGCRYYAAEQTTGRRQEDLCWLPSRRVARRRTTAVVGERIGSPKLMGSREHQSSNESYYLHATTTRFRASSTEWLTRAAASCERSAPPAFCRAERYPVSALRSRNSAVREGYGGAEEEWASAVASSPKTRVVQSLVSPRGESLWARATNSDATTATSPGMQLWDDALDDALELYGGGHDVFSSGAYDEDDYDLDDLCSYTSSWSTGDSISSAASSSASCVSSSPLTAAAPWADLLGPENGLPTVRNRRPRNCKITAAEIVVSKCINLGGSVSPVIHGESQQHRCPSGRQEKRESSPATARKSRDRAARPLSFRSKIKRFFKKLQEKGGNVTDAAVSHSMPKEMMEF